MILEPGRTRKHPPHPAVGLILALVAGSLLVLTILLLLGRV